MKSRNWRLAIARLSLATVMMVPALAFADQLVMKNGDVITGEVKKVEDNKIFIAPAYASEFSVDLAEVVSIEAEKVYEVELEDGTEVNAQFAGATDDGQQTLIVDDAEVNVSVAQVAVAAPPQAYYERVSHVDLNMTWNDGNTNDKTNLLFADTQLRLGDHRHLAELTIARDETNDISTKEQDLLRYTYNWLFNEPWFLGMVASYERDPIKDLSYRFTMGPLVGRDIFNDSRKFLTFGIGLGYSAQKLGGESDGGAASLWHLTYEHKFREGALAFFHNQNMSYQFYGENNLIVRTKTGFRFDILKNLYTSVAYQWDYETEPAPNTKDFDTTLAIGLGAKF
jgi:hypothetical protein